MDIPTINLARTGANITNLRKAAGLSVHDLQMAFGFNSPQAIYKWQNGTALPTVDNLIALAALLHVRMDDISTDFANCQCVKSYDVFDCFSLTEYLVRWAHLCYHM